MDDSFFIVEYPDDPKYAEDAALLSDEWVPHYDYDRYDRCPRCGKIVSGPFWLPPRKIVLTSRKVPDFFYLAGANVPFLISENALRGIREAGLTGIKSAEPIDYARFLRQAKKEVSIPNYYLIEVERSIITIDQERSVVEYKESEGSTQCPLCHPVHGTSMAAKNLHWNMEGFENYDIFKTYEMCSTLFVSKRFVEFCRDHNYSNLHCCPASEWKLGHFGLEDLLPKDN